MAGISITLAGNFTKLDELKDKASKTASSIKSSFKAVTGTAAFGGLAIGATAAFAAVTASIAKVIDHGGELNDMMLRTGASGKGLLILQKAFANAGIAADKVPSVLNKMQKALAGVNEEGQPTTQAFDKLGLSIEELQNLDPVEAFQKTAQAIASIQTPAQRTTAAMEIFGKSGGELLAVMNDPGAWAQAREQIGSLGDTLPGMAGDLDSVGDALGSFGAKSEQLGARLAVGLLPYLESLTELINSINMGTFDITNPFSSELKPADREAAKQKAADMAKDDPLAGKSSTEVEKQKLDAANSYFWQKKETEKQDAIKKRTDIERAAAEKQAESDKKTAAAKERTRAAALEEYNLESQMITARLKGDADRIATLEREKKIREEMKRLQDAGFTAKEARKPAEAKVDAEKKATAQEAEKAKIEATLQGKLDEVKLKQSGLQFESSIGSISSMQRIGGGGGAVGSGLDYQRTATDLQREANSLIRQLIEATRREVEA